MTSRYASLLFTLLVPLFVFACGDDDNTTPPDPCAACTPEQACIDNVCTDVDPVCDPACTADQTCVNGTCQDDTPTCSPACTAGQECVNGTCQDIPCSPACGAGQECVAGTCQDIPCSPACDAHQECVAGTCEDIPCDPACGEHQECIDEVCEDIPCDPACGANQECVDEVCQDIVCDPACGEHQECVAGTCEDIACDPACGEHQECIDEVCQDIACDPACGAGQECVDEVCVDLCDPECTGGQVCEAGVCVTPCDPVCGDNFECVDGACVEVCPTECGARQHCVDQVCEYFCEEACTADQTCIVGYCRDNACDPACDAADTCINGVCVTVGATHTGAMLDGPFGSGQEVTAACLVCHSDMGTHFMETSHWNWSGPTPGMEGHDTGSDVGKVNTINNYCIATASNEGRCTQCHAGYGWKNNTFDLTNSANIDCLICHDGSHTYAKAPKTAGGVADGVDLQVVAKSVTLPDRANCGKCHFNAGGGDNVKKGDMGSWAADPSDDADVHMGANNMTCTACHAAGTGATNEHMITGGGLHNPVEEAPLACTDCHGAPGGVHASATTPPANAAVLDTHTAHVACETCHIPAFSRQQPTKVNWLWSEAGDADRVPVNDENGKPDYNKLKGEFTWGMNVAPTIAWYDGTFKRMIVGDTFTMTADNKVDLGSPNGDINNANAVLSPFKVMTGNQPADLTHNKMIVPHLFGMGAGPNPYWAAFDWDLANTEGMAYIGEDFDVANWDFVDTFMYQEIHHEVAPKADARMCDSCHGANGLDWASLGYTGNPADAGYAGPLHATN